MINRYTSRATEDSPLCILADANIWFSRTLRDWFLQIQSHMDKKYFPNIPPCSLYWTEDIIAEAHSTMRNKKPLQSESFITTAITKIKETLTDQRKISGYIPEETDLTTDPGDFHVVAAALHGNMDILLTKDKTFAECGNYEIWTPDDLFKGIVDIDEALILTVLEEQFRYWSEKYNRGEIPSLNLSKKLIDSGAPEFGKKCTKYLALMI